MQTAPWLKEAIILGKQFHYNTKTPWVHNTINALTLAGCFVGMTLALALASLGPWWLTIVPSAILYGYFVIGAGALTFHEAAHKMCWVSRDPERARRANHLTGQAASLLFNTDFPHFWEDLHPVHHKDPFASGDTMMPDCVGGRSLLRTCLKVIFVPGYALVRNRSRTFSFPDPRLFGWLAVWSVVIGALWMAFGWASAAAFIVGQVLLDVLVLVRQAQEHPLGTDAEPHPRLRGRTITGFLAMAFGPMNQNYHFEHHLNYSVPWYSLPAYHARVKHLVPEELRHFYFADGTGAFLAQLAGTRELPPEIVGKPRAAR